MIRIYFLFLFLFFVSCSVDNEEDYFALNCVTEDIYYISVDLSRSVSNMISNKCLNCHAIDNMELSGSWLPLETHEQLITIDFDEHVLNSNASMPPAGSPQLTDCEMAQISSWVNNNFPYNESGR
mgnify:FL=1